MPAAGRTAQEARDAALRATQGVLRGLINELDAKSSSTDPRWRAFGFNCPGDVQVPGQVLNLVVSPCLARSLLLDWDAAPRGARYQVEMRLMAPEAEWTLMTTVAEERVTLTDLTPGANVQLRIIAVNDGGVAVPSEAVQAHGLGGVENRSAPSSQPSPPLGEKLPAGRMRGDSVTRMERVPTLASGVIAEDRLMF